MSNCIYSRDKFLDLSKLKVFADDKINVTVSGQNQAMCIFLLYMSYSQSATCKLIKELVLSLVIRSLLSSTKKTMASD